jgi:hypothetical protein
MNLLQRFYSAVINASDAFGASMQREDVMPTGDAGQVADPDDEDLAWGSIPPTNVAFNSAVPSVRAHAHDLDDELRESRWRDLDDADRSVEW